MGRKSTISYDDIATEAQRMINDGINPTVNGIAKATGGNSKTVSQHLAKWRADREKTQGATERLLQLATDIKTTALNEAQTKIDQRWEEIDEQEALLAKERDVFHTKLQASQEQVAFYQQELLEAKQAYDKLLPELQQERQQREQTALLLAEAQGMNKSLRDGWHAKNQELQTLWSW